ncbi:MAG: hypothetical protein AAF383_24285 [Cyanobacteria bacterium P01_A01_bin.83]
MTSSISNATTSNHNRLNIVLENRVAGADDVTDIPLNIKTNGQLFIVNNKLNLDRELQLELEREIYKTQNKLMRSSEFVEQENTLKIGLVYIHQGYKDWRLQFTYGGYLLNTKEKIIVTTSEILELKKTFANTKSLQIANNKYQTTRYMSQLGGILHQ